MSTSPIIGDYNLQKQFLKIQSNIATSIDSGKVNALTLLDLSAAFDAIDHNITLW